MSNKIMALALAGAVLSGPVLAQEVVGDAEAGAKVFAKCQTCHTVTDPAGQMLAGKGAKTGPNLYGVAGRTAGTYPEFKYGKSMIALGETGFAWDEESFLAYVADPSKFLKEKLNDKAAKGNMSFKLANATDAQNVWAYLVSLAPAAEAAPASN